MSDDPDQNTIKVINYQLMIIFIVAIALNYHFIQNIFFPSVFLVIAGKIRKYL